MASVQERVCSNEPWPLRGWSESWEGTLIVAQPLAVDIWIMLRVTRWITGELGNQGHDTVDTMDCQVRYLSTQHGDSPCDKGAPVDKSYELTVQRAWVAQIPWFVVWVGIPPTIITTGSRHHEDVGDGLSMSAHNIMMNAFVFSVREKGSWRRRGDRRRH